MNETNEQPNDPSPRTGAKAVGVAFVVLVGLIAGVAISSFTKARSTSQQNACIGNMRIIDSAKEQAAMGYRLKNGDTVTISQVHEYIKGNTTPICPAGGTYIYWNVGTQPDCSIVTPTSHLLP